jgi:succinoglycan biosynthesis protein ExoU
MQESICVVIAARDASGTIAGAVRSALDQAPVRRVIVVDDASGDTTAEQALAAAAGDTRLNLIRCAVNGGPSAARNLAIAASDEPLIAILDADDAFLPGRFERLLAVPDWDLIADNIAFVQDMAVPVQPRPGGAAFHMQTAEFVRGNIGRAGVVRGEYGFLKPVLRRAFLEQHGLRYDEALRLGEDYDLYLRMLLAGARFPVLADCGYRALLRSNSLSSRHRTEDLQRLMQVDQQVLARPDLDPDLAGVLRDHLAQTSAKFHHRRFLDQRHGAGLVSAVRQLGVRADAWQAVVGGVARDKLAGFRHRQPPVAEPVRYLLNREG